MSPNKDLEPIAESMTEVFNRLGLPDPALMSQLHAAWETVAPKLWRGRSKPVSIRGSTLVVEAASPSLVSFLKYGQAELLESLKKQFGTGAFDQVEVRPPGTD